MTGHYAPLVAGTNRSTWRIIGPSGIQSKAHYTRINVASNASHREGGGKRGMPKIWHWLCSLSFQARWHV